MAVRLASFSIHTPGERAAAARIGNRQQPSAGNRPRLPGQTDRGGDRWFNAGTRPSNTSANRGSGGSNGGGGNNIGNRQVPGNNNASRDTSAFGGSSSRASTQASSARGASSLGSSRGASGGSLPWWRGRAFRRRSSGSEASHGQGKNNALSRNQSLSAEDSLDVLGDCRLLHFAYRLAGGTAGCERHISPGCQSSRRRLPLRGRPPTP